MKNENIQIENNALVLFGGSFDPVTKAHEQIVKNLKARFATTIVMPSNISPFKKRGSFASSENRLEMLSLALKPDGDSLLISDFEIKNEGISYTVDTVRHIKTQYPNRPMYIAIGSEILKKLHKWYDFDVLKTFVTFYIIERPNFALENKKIVRWAKKHEANIILADFVGEDYSSSQARLDIAFKKFESIPESVAKYIQTHNLYNDFNFIVNRFKEFNLGDKRITHIYNTALEAINRAKTHSASEYEATLVALLHDIAKKIEHDDLIQYDINVADIYGFSDKPDKIKHAFVGSEVAKVVFGIRKKSLLDAIKFHTTGAPKMGKLAKILFVADFSEQGRDWEIDRETLLYVRSEKNLNKAVKAILECKKFFVEKKGKEIYHLTRDALEFYTPKPKINKDDRISPANDNNKSTQTRNEKILSLNQTHLAYTIAQVLDDKLGKDITLINIAKKTIIADYFVIATANSTTAVRALVDHVDEELSKKHGIEPLRRDINRDWSAIDYGSVILHVQLPDTRQFYNLERLWSDGENIEKY
ncbi:MAG: nicotinate (nicotinamide) nucleotide adenylyltransferase [Firmicutes bacterium]|nr:nicotinate (nicotinamide) nucleotide adenylyltransferase [Bacillota bacterium]